MTNPRDRIPQLDSLRAIACLLVLVAHLDSLYGMPKWPPEMGSVGVAIFFALSGFLITRGLISAPIRLFEFYNKRATRILPAYFLLLVVVGLRWCSHELWWCATFAFNFLFVTGARDYFHVQSSDGTSSPVAHLWSLCVEEHYYWVWPLILLVCSRRVANLLLIGIVLATPAIAWAIVVALDIRGVHPDVFAGVVSRITLTQLTALSLGSLLALHEGAMLRSINFGRLRIQPILVAGGAAVFACLAIRQGTISHWWSSSDQQLCYQPTLIHLLGAGLMAVGLCIPTLGRLPFLPYLGRISYGMYLYHLPIYVAYGLAHSGRTELWLTGVMALLTTLGMAALSFHYIEQPIIRWGRRGGSQATAIVPRYGALLAVVLCLACFVTLASQRFRQPLASILNLVPSMPLEQRRQILAPLGAAVGGYRWLGVDHYADILGFRRTTPFPTKTPDRKRIITVGDSFTWGACVNERSTYSAVLEQLLRLRGMSIEVLNGGRAGGQAEDILQTLEEELLKHRPDAIIYAATTTDFLPANVAWEGHTIDEWYIRENQERFEVAVQGMKQLCDQQKIDFYLFAFIQNPSDTETVKIAKLIETLGRKVDANVISVESYLLDNARRDFRIYDPFDNHPNADCHRIHAELLAERLAPP
ncbi:MAG: acyltransferase family protein [Planctomycetota bacterium]|nr:acyltransferase family protein [Planctomycetota bacterium]